MLILINIFAFFIIVSNGALFYEGSRLHSALNWHVLPVDIKAIIMYFVFLPIEISRLFPSALFMRGINHFLSFIGIVCGLGILKHRDIARNYAVTISFLRIFCGFFIFMHSHYRSSGGFRGIDLQDIIIAVIRYSFFILCIYFFTQARVKKQFGEWG